MPAFEDSCHPFYPWPHWENIKRLFPEFDLNNHRQQIACYIGRGVESPFEVLIVRGSVH